jgi:hypothetical protein
MANRFGRAVGGVSPFDPKGAVIDALPGVARGAGQDDEALFSVGSELAGIFGRQADQQAAIEGKRSGTIAGNDPAFRPTGATTIRGKAFDDAATASYLDTLDAKMRGGMLDVFQANKDNPAGLKAGFDQLKADILQNEAFPEVSGQISASFERLRLPFAIKALDTLETKMQDQARAAATEADVRSSGVVAAAVESAPYNPRTQAVVRQELGAAAARDRALVAQGALTETQAVQRRITREREAVTREAIAAVDEIKTVEELDRREADYKTRKAEGRLGKVGEDAKIMDELEAGLARKRTQLTTVGKQAGLSVEKQAEDMLSRAQNGAMPPVEELSRFRAVAAQAPNGAMQVEQFDRRLGWIRTATTAGPDGVDAKTRELRKAYGPTPTKEQAEDLQFLEDLSGKFRKATVEDPIGLAARQRVAAVAPITMDDPAALRDGIRERAALARALPAEINPNGKMLQPEDVKAIERKIAMGGQGALDTVQALVDGAGRDAPRLMREIGGQAPELAQAGLLLASGGSKQAARDIIASVAARSLPGGQKPVEVDNGTFRQIWVDKIGTSLVYNSQDSQRIEKAARAIASARIQTLGNVKDSAAKEIYARAIDEAFGGQTIDGKAVGGLGRVKTGWFSSAPVPLPPDVRADRFSDVLAAIRDDDLPGLPVPPVAGTRAAQIRNARPVAVPGGYRFALGDPAGQDPKFIQGQDGKPFVLPWDSVKGVLRERAPGAFVGSR